MFLMLTVSIVNCPGKAPHTHSAQQVAMGRPGHGSWGWVLVRGSRLGGLCCRQWPNTVYNEAHQLELPQPGQLDEA